MTTVSTKSGRIIKVVSREEEKSTLTESDNEMDKRAVEAVKAAINKAKICRVCKWEKKICKYRKPLIHVIAWSKWLVIILIL